jgi:hypothetical protein
VIVEGLRPRISLAPAVNRFRDGESVLELPAPRVRCRVQARKGRGSVITGEGPWVHNTVVVGGLNNLADSLFSTLATYCHVGVGTQAVSSGDAGLGSFFAASNSVQNAISDTNSTPPYYARRQITWRFAAGTFDGNQPLTEIAISNQATNGNILARALVHDPVNVFTAVTPRADEWADVTYEFRLYPDHVNADGAPLDLTGIVEVWGEAHSFWLRPAFVTNISYWDASQARAQLRSVSSTWARFFGSTSVLGAVGGEPTNPSGGYATTSESDALHSSYTPGTFMRAAHLVVAPTEGNASGGIGAMRFHTGLGAYQVRFAPAIPKDISKAWTFSAVLDWSDAGLV